MKQQLMEVTCTNSIAYNECQINHSVTKSLLRLGDSCRRAMYFYLDDRGMTSEQIPFQGAGFHRALRSIFGSGADVLEAFIKNDLWAVANGKLDKPDCSRCEADWLDQLGSQPNL